MTGLYCRAYGAFISKFDCFLRLDDKNQDSNDTMPSCGLTLVFTKNPVVRSTLSVFLSSLYALLIGQSQKYLAKYTWSRFRTSELTHSLERCYENTTRFPQRRHNFIRLPLQLLSPPNYYWSSS